MKFYKTLIWSLVFSVTYLSYETSARADAIDLENFIGQSVTSAFPKPDPKVNWVMGFNHAFPTGIYAGYIASKSAACFVSVNSQNGKYSATIYKGAYSPSTLSKAKVLASTTLDGNSVTGARISQDTKTGEFVIGANVSAAPKKQIILAGRLLQGVKRNIENKEIVIYLVGEFGMSTQHCQRLSQVK